ncbi:unnamed protein product [Trichogramma brassicae]|uniref:Uncharacterized protein n=1 Tax=Trichogramma brassicae TaxID=86971 RepID=A0A6H5INB9_9HYME|nr:unnamed protein product [Trichogramma brassicae]
MLCTRATVAVYTLTSLRNKSEELTTSEEAYIERERVATSLPRDPRAKGNSVCKKLYRSYVVATIPWINALDPLKIITQHNTCACDRIVQHSDSSFEKNPCDSRIHIYKYFDRLRYPARLRGSVCNATRRVIYERVSLSRERGATSSTHTA